jgi:hypothetical protein
MAISPQEVERMFNRVAGLLSGIRPRSKTLTEEERLSREGARLESLSEREEARLEALRELQEHDRHDWRKIGPGGGGGGST